MVNFDLFNPNLISRDFFHFLQFWWEWRTMIHSREIMQLQNGSKNTWNICLSIKTKMEAMDNIFLKKIYLCKKSPDLWVKIIPYLCDIEHTLNQFFTACFQRNKEFEYFINFWIFAPFRGSNIHGFPLRAEGTAYWLLRTRVSKSCRPFSAK